MTEVRELLARNIKRCRGILKISQAQLAERVGCSTTLIGNIETKKRFPSAENLDRIASALEVHPSELFMEDSAAITAMRAKYEVRDGIEGKVLEAIGKAFDDEKSPSAKRRR
jgi:transcriptional regulator with XRE-family HTH domain